MCWAGPRCTSTAAFLPCEVNSFAMASMTFASTPQISAYCAMVFSAAASFMSWSPLFTLTGPFSDASSASTNSSPSTASFSSFGSKATGFPSFITTRNS